ncbi:hypothetical protein [Microbulbifer sp. SAOS-129_SWC]|uniref:hypothetical protein n=1 Tax=Microbulbifer sp. SAOS-129_SWC TaxID=3145235 RepID=UPI0032173036
MRNNTETFDLYNQAPQRELRLVIEIGYDLPLYLASHADIPGLPANAILGCIEKVSSTSQRLIPEQGRAEIGALSFDVVDVAGQLTYVLRDELQSGSGIKGRRVRLYQGGRGMAWADFRLEQTQIAEESLAYDAGAYRVRCRDIQREMRQDIFVPHSTRLAADFAKGASTLQVYDTSKFEPCDHIASFSEGNGSAQYYYLKIKYQDGYEIVRATGKTATSFTGCVRARFGTVEADHTVPAEADDEKGIEVEEYIYLEMPGPMLAYSLLTGDMLGWGTLPSNWHLGIDPATVEQDDFLNIGADWYQPGDHTKGRILRFAGLTKTDGKKFIEQEINLLLGAFMPVNAAGQLGYRRMTGVLANAGTVATIGVDDVTSVGALDYELADVRNVFTIHWSWYEAPKVDGHFVRDNTLVDADSIAIHKVAKKHTLKFRGLHGSRHTYTAIKNTFDALRDRFAGPPLRLRLGLLPSKNDLEVGDIVRVTLPQVRDHSQDVAGGTLDRAMEIQRISVDQVSGAVTAELFGSYQAAGNVLDQDAAGAASYELPDSWYDDAGTELTAAGISIDGSGFMTADASLSEGTYYYLGDLTIPAGTVLSTSGTVQLNVRGTFQNEGDIVATSSNSGRGFLGSCRGGDGTLKGKYFYASPAFVSTRGETVTGRNEVMPALAIDNDGGDLLGLPDDLRGSGGADGGPGYFYDYSNDTYNDGGAGGAGGNGGGGLVVVARGIAFGVSGKITTSGADGSPGENSGPTYTAPGGSGGGGAPGGVVLLVDGTGNPFPLLTSGKIVADYGSSPTSPGKAGEGDRSLGTAAARVLFVPRSRTPYPDEADPTVDAEVLAAQQAAAAAQADADANTAALDDIAADGKLAPDEKLQVIREYNQQASEKTALDSQADDYGLTAEKSSLGSAWSALTSYLQGLSPAWNDKTQATAISRTLFDSNWQNYYDAKVALLNAAADAAAQRANWSQVSDDGGRPQDNATVGALPAEVSALARGAVSTMHSGGFGDLRFEANKLTNGDPNDGEIRVLGSKFYHPDGTTRSVASPTAVNTTYEGNTTVDVFYLVWTDEAPASRFASLSFGNSTQFFPAIYDPVIDTWRAQDNNGATATFTPRASDCIVAVGRKTSVSGGVDSLSSLVGVNQNLPEDGATANGLTSLVYDPGFESYGFTNASSGWSRVSGAGEDGTGAMVGTADGSSNFYGWVTGASDGVTLKVDCRKHDRFYLRMRIKADNGIGRWRFNLHGHDASNTAVEYSTFVAWNTAGSFVDDGTWQTVEGLVEVANTNTRWAQFYAQIEDEATAGKQLFIDSVEIWKVAEGVSNAALTSGDILNGTGWETLPASGADVTADQIDSLRPDASYKNSSISEANVKAATGWAATPESGATRNTGALADLSSIGLTSGYLTGLLPSYKAELILRNDYLSLSSDGYLTYDDGGPVNIGAVTKSGLGMGNVENKSSATIRNEIVAGNIPEGGVYQYIGGRGANLNHPAYTRFIGYAPPPFVFAGNCTAALTAVSSSPIGATALQVTVTDNSSVIVLDLRPTVDQPLLNVDSGKKYIFSAWMVASASGIKVKLYGTGAGSSPVNVPVGTSATLTPGWQRVSFLATASNGSGGCAVRLQINNTTVAVNDYVRIDGVMVEEAIGDQTEPSALQQTGANYIDPYTGQPFDSRGLPQSIGGSPSIMTSAALSASDNGTSAKIAIAAHTAQYPGFTVSFNAGSITGLAFSTRYHVYCDDPGYAGGAVTYFATTSLADVAAGVYRRYIGTLTTPADGGGGTGPIDPECTAAGMWLLPNLLIDHAEADDLIQCWDVGREDAYYGPIQAISSSEELCVEVEMESGATWIGSAKTPVTAPDGTVCEAQDCRGMMLGVLHHDDPLVFERVVAVRWAGVRTVYHLSAYDTCYAAGVDPDHRVMTHNLQYKP